ncbi:DUF1484 domain-containing protein [Xenophilus sp. AP218F]|nr:DUF1484 domain-containing protein [Xenophilus sp. AP218F]
MTSISRSASHFAVPHSTSSRQRWLVHSGMSTHPSHASLLAMAQLHAAFEALQVLLSQPDHADLRAPVAQLAHLCREIEHAVVESVCLLAQSQLGLQALLDLLSCLGEDIRLPSSRLKGLLQPVDRQITASLGYLSKVL